MQHISSPAATHASLAESQGFDKPDQLFKVLESGNHTGKELIGCAFPQLFQKQPPAMMLVTTERSKEILLDWGGRGGEERDFT